MSTINQEDVLLIMKLLDESQFDELHLVIGEIELHVRKHGNFDRLPEIEQGDYKSTPASVFGTEGAGSSSKNMPTISTPGRESVAPAVAPMPRDEKAAEGLITIKAPMLGTFYRTPKPGAPPFVEVGAWVNEDDPVAIIEVMKLFNTVKAGVQGRIAKICAEQGQLVEYQQILFLVEKKSAKDDFPRSNE